MAAIEHAHMKEIQNLQCTYDEMAKSDTQREAVTAPSTPDPAREIRTEEEA